MEKRILKTTISALIIVLVLAGSVALTGGHAETLSIPEAQATTESQPKTVQVSGTGEVQVEPDSAVISLGVQTDADTAQAALNENNTKVQSLLDSLTKSGIPSKNIQTQRLNLLPRYENNNNNQKLVGYTASNIVKVQTDKLDSLGSLIDQAVKNGANTIENISFEVSDPEKWADQAREMAVQNAQHKAEQLAKLTNASLGPVLEIQETSNTHGPILQSVAPAAQVSAVPVSPGSQSISVDIQVTWTLVTSGSQ